MALNVIALISGGKDSFFSILHCIANGHNIVALANLHPSPSAGDNEDLNSYMYQTVGHSVIPLYEQALGIPLYRQEITGTAVNAERDYSAPRAEQEQDETEDLVPLLRKAMLAHPQANAVCSGAILSTYQRTRVESVALRLGLTPLSFLWQYPLLPPYSQSQLLFDMAAVGLEAIIIKTASGGLDERILGWNVAAQSTITRLQKAMAKFGEESNGAVVGEGGEFETLALDGPRPVWKKRIRIEPGAAGESEGGQSVLRMRASELEEKSEGGGNDDEDWKAALRIPELFDDEFKRVLEAEQEASHDARSFVSDDATLLNEPAPPTPSSFDDLPRNASVDSPTVFTYSNLSDTSRSSIPSTPSPSRQLTKVLLRLDHVLKQWNLSRTAINHCTLLLRSMADFTVLNPIYAQYFSNTNPPARVTVAVGDCMPSGIDVMLSITIDKAATDRKGKLIRPVARQGLHVQGRSYWAPANIGPYSQAISARLPLHPNHLEASAGDLVYVAGQIPLVPASMALYAPHDFKAQATLSLQHLWRIGRAKSVRWWTAAVAFIPAGTHPEDKVRVAQAAWRAIHSPASTAPSSSSHTNPSSDSEEEEDDDDDPVIDPWDARNTHVPSFTDTTSRPPLPDPAALTFTTPHPIPPPCFIAQVAALPRDAAIEWSATGLTSRAIYHSVSPLAPSLTLTAPAHAASRFYSLAIRGRDDTDALRRLGEDSVKGAWEAATLYVTPQFGDGADGPGLGRKWSWRGVQWVPCQRVWDAEGRECAAVLVGRVDGAGADGEGTGTGVGSAGGRDKGEKGGVGGFVKGLRFAGKEVREALEM